MHYPYGIDCRLGARCAFRHGLDIPTSSVDIVCIVTTLK